MIKAEIKGTIWDLQEVASLISGAAEDVELTINSPGGNAIEGMNVARAILANANVKVIANVETIAASAAATIALACDTVRMSKLDILILHHCWTMAVGNKEELAQTIDAMKHLDDILEEYLTKHCKNEESVELLKERMAEGDVFLNAEEAAELFDNVELVEMPDKEAMQNVVNLGAMAAKYNAMAKELAELKAEQNNKYEISDEVKAIIDEVL